MLTIRPATPEDHRPISIVLDSAFGQPNELRLVEALRRSGAAAVELVAEEADGLSGHIMLSWLTSPDGWMALAPVSVRHARQGHGIGAELVRYGLDAGRRAGAAAVVVVGDPAYYGRFGFVFDGPADLASPYPRQYTGLYPFDPDAARGRAVLVYPEPFAAV